MQEQSNTTPFCKINKCNTFQLKITGYKEWFYAFNTKNQHTLEYLQLVTQELFVWGIIMNGNWHYSEFNKTGIELTLRSIRRREK